MTGPGSPAHPREECVSDAEITDPRQLVDVADGWRVTIEHDPDEPDPRVEFDQLATLLTRHRRYRLPFEAPVGRAAPGGVDLGQAMDERGPWVVARWLRVCHDAVILPVWGHDHGGLALAAGVRTGQFGDRFDSGLAGIAYLPRPRLRDSCDGHYPGDDHAEALIIAEVDQYNQYLTGDVWGYIIERWVECRDSCLHCPGGVWEHAESLWGMYGRAYCEREAVAAQAALVDDVDHRRHH